MQDDQQKWDKRFRSKPLVQPKAPAFIIERASLLPGGRCLDVAAGDGAAALYLAAMGSVRQVTALDISPVGLSRCRQFAEVQALSINTVALDLDDHANLLSTLGEQSFDEVVVCHFKPSTALFRALTQLLVPGGHLLLTTFNVLHHQHNGFPKRFCLTPEEFFAVDSGLECLWYQSVERKTADSINSMDDYHFIKIR